MIPMKKNVLLSQTHAIRMRTAVSEPFTNPGLRRKWMGLCLLLLLMFLFFPTTTNRMLPSLTSRVIQPLPQTATETSVFDPFPFPDALQPQVDFWTTIFTQYTTDQVVIHDSWYVNVMYEVINLNDPKFTTPEDAKKAVEAARKKYEQLLTRIGKKWDTPETMIAVEREIYKKFQPFPDSLRFAKKDAKDRVRAQVGQADRFKEGIIRAGGYLAVMKQIMAEHQLPESLVYLPLIESAFNPFAESYVGAAGMWQFMRSTGKQYHLAIDAQVDERKDPLRATQAAAQLLATNYEATKAWPLAITAYNHGLQGIRNAAKNVGSEDIAEIIERYDGPAFGFASRNFYPEFLAAVNVCQQYPKYFGEIELHPPLTLTQVTLPDYVSAQTLEKYTGLSVADLKKLNPALHSSVFTSGNFLPKKIALNIQAEQKASFETAYARIPQSLKYQYVAVKAKHQVKKGETLSAVASRYHTTVNALMKANNLKSSRKIIVGQTLKIPGGYVDTKQTTVASAQPSTAPTPSAAPAKKAAAPSTQVSAQHSSTGTHRVQKGQTLITIARQYETSVEALAQVNGLKNIRLIKEGQVLKIPTTTTQITATAPKATPTPKPSATTTQTATTAPTARSTPKPSVTTTHKVQKGQTLTAIAKRYNTTVQALTSLNKIKNPGTLRTGQILKIPQG
jgi:membrane-bound lytic murein transglycosylase D